MKTTLQMKKLLFALLFATLLTAVGCNRSNVVRYELVDGDPTVDYIEFLNDSVCRYVAPGPITLVSPYTVEGEVLTVHINGVIKANLYQFEKNQLVGEAPFFEGVWKKK